MDGIDMNKLEIALKYVDRISKGHNPVNNLPAEDDSTLNNPNIIRCMYFIKEILEKVKEQEIFAVKKETRKNVFPIDLLNQFQYQEDKSIVHFLTQLYLPLEKGTYKRISPQRITSWLKENDYLTEEIDLNTGKSVTIPTDKGKNLEIYTETRTFNGKKYLAVIYGKSAQELIIKIIPEIINISK